MCGLGIHRWFTQCRCSLRTHPLPEVTDTMGMSEGRVDCGEVGVTGRARVSCQP